MEQKLPQEHMGRMAWRLPAKQSPESIEQRDRNRFDKRAGEVEPFSQPPAHFRANALPQAGYNP
jgi:hypothetical protein